MHCSLVSYHDTIVIILIPIVNWSKFCCTASLKVEGILKSLREQRSILASEKMEFVTQNLPPRKDLLSFPFTLKRVKKEEPAIMTGSHCMHCNLTVTICVIVSAHRRILGLASVVCVLVKIRVSSISLYKLDTDKLTAPFESAH